VKQLALRCSSIDYIRKGQCIGWEGFEIRLCNLVQSHLYLIKCQQLRTRFD
jgi:hypothetical protein